MGFKVLQTFLTGSSPNVYYRTPAEFFSGSVQDPDLADTVAESVYTLDSTGTVRNTVASGVRIFLPNIPDVGVIRTRSVLSPMTCLRHSHYLVWKL